MCKCNNFYIIRIKSRDNEMTEGKDIQSQYKVKISDNASVSHKQILARTKITISATQHKNLHWHSQNVSRSVIVLTEEYDANMDAKASN